MANEIYAGPLGELRLAGASKGVACTTTAVYTGLPEGTHYIALTPRNFATAVVVRFALCPYLTIFKTTDDLATDTNLTEYSSEAQDADTATSVVLSSLDTAANSDYLYVGSHVPFAGVHCDVDAVNANASVLTVKYWNGAAWTDISDTDNTTSGGKTMAQDGTVTWTVPAAWVPNTLAGIRTILTTDLLKTVQHALLHNHDLYWTRWEVSAALDSSTTLDHMIAMPRSTAYGELLPGQPFEETINMAPGGFGGVVSLTDAGTANLVINCATRGSARRFA